MVYGLYTSTNQWWGLQLHHPIGEGRYGPHHPIGVHPIVYSLVSSSYRGVFPEHRPGQPRGPGRAVDERQVVRRLPP